MENILQQHQFNWRIISNMPCLCVASTMPHLLGLTCWWVSEMLNRSVEESREKQAAVRQWGVGAVQWVVQKSLQRVWCVNITLGSPLWRTFRCRSSFCPNRGLNPHRWGTSAPEAKVLTTIRPPVVPYASGIGAGLYSTTAS